MVKTAPHVVSKKCHQSGCETGRGEECKSSEVNARAVSRGQNELKGKFKMAAGDVISIGGQVMEYTYILTGIKRELVRSGVDCNRKGGGMQVI